MPRLTPLPVSWNITASRQSGGAQRAHNLFSSLGALSLFLLTLLLAPTLQADGPAASSEIATPLSDEALAEVLLKLNGRKSRDKAQAIEALAESGHPRARRLLEAARDSELFYQRKGKRIVFASEIEKGWAVTHAVTGEDLGTTRKRGVRRVVIPNKIRKALRGIIAALDLRSGDVSERLAAVRRLTGESDPEVVSALRKAQQEEPDPSVQDALQVAVAVADLGAEAVESRLAAIEMLSDRLDQTVQNHLRQVSENDTDPAVQAAASAALSAIEKRLKSYAQIETAFFGLGLGAVLALAAVGLAITFGVMGVINMAHGELIMIGAYTAFVMQEYVMPLFFPGNISLAILLAIPAAFLVSGLVGILIERGVIRFLYGRPLETLLATFGLSLILQQAVRSIFTPLNRSVSSPEWLSGAMEINSALSLTYNRLYIIGFTLLVFALLFLLLHKTRLGLRIRAVTQNRTMARAMGVRSDWVDALAFGLGAGVAGIAGVALSQLTNVGPNLGQAYIVDSFMVVVFGGVGNLFGTLLGGFSLGLVNKFLEPEIGAVLAKVLVLVLIILFIQKRPKGLFPQKGRAAEA